MPPNDPSVVNAISTLVEEVIEEAKSLRTDIQAYEDAHRRERRAYRFMAAFLAAAIAMSVLLIITVRNGIESQDAVLARVNSCTTPGGECYEANEENLVHFRQRLLGVIAVITDCDVHTDDLERFRDCVTLRTGLHAAAVSQPVDLGDGRTLGDPVDPAVLLPTAKPTPN